MSGTLCMCTFIWESETGRIGSIRASITLPHPQGVIYKHAFTCPRWVGLEHTDSAPKWFRQLFFIAQMLRSRSNNCLLPFKSICFHKRRRALREKHGLYKPNTLPYGLLWYLQSRFKTQDTSRALLMCLTSSSQILVLQKSILQIAVSVTLLSI